MVTQQVRRRADTRQKAAQHTGMTHLPCAAALAHVRHHWRHAGCGHGQAELVSHTQRPQAEADEPQDGAGGEVVEGLADPDAAADEDEQRAEEGEDGPEEDVARHKANEAHGSRADSGAQGADLSEGEDDVEDARDGPQG